MISINNFEELFYYSHTKALFLLIIFIVFGRSFIINLKNYILGAFRISFFLVPEKIFVFTALLTAVKSLSTKLLIDAI